MEEMNEMQEFTTKDGCTIRYVDTDPRGEGEGEGKKCLLLVS
jgi:hypothetical protein